jgi:zinc transporter ZupT
MRNRNLSSPVLVVLIVIAIPVTIGLSMVTVAAGFAVLYRLFTDGGFSDGWSLAWDQPVRLAIVAGIMSAYKLLVRLGDKYQEQERLVRR